MLPAPGTSQASFDSRGLRRSAVAHESLPFGGGLGTEIVRSSGGRQWIGSKTIETSLRVRPGESPLDHENLHPNVSMPIE